MRLRSPRDTRASTAVQTWESTMTTPDLDALIEQYPEINPGNYGEDDAIALNNWGIDAVAALAELREENARHGADMKLLRDEVTRLKDHYEYEILAGENDCKKHAGKVYMNCVVCRAERAEARIAELERERDALVQLREQRDEWHKAWIGMEKRAERAEAEVLILRNDLATYADRIAALEAALDMETQGRYSGFPE